MQTRLAALRAELESGRAELQRVEARRVYLHETMLQIGGAIKVLEEFLVDGQTAAQNGASSGEVAPAARAAGAEST
jgi:hypothetical protein